jgi:hypothetical protein
MRVVIVALLSEAAELSGLESAGFLCANNLPRCCIARVRAGAISLCAQPRRMEQS